jgi:hypothetical protein
MTTPPLEPSKLAQTAAEDPAVSVENERAVIGDQPDTGELVSPDRSQSAPESS